MSPVASAAYNNKLLSMAGRQMLIYHAEYEGVPEYNPYRVNFIQNLTNIGFPNNLRKIAIANGSGNGTLQKKNDGSDFNPRDKIVAWRYRNGWTVDIDGNAWALPNFSPSTLIFEGRVAFTPLGYVGNGFKNGDWTFFTKSEKVYANNTYSFDNAPGGTYDYAQEIADGDTKGLGDIETIISSQSFIPTISSLCINTLDESNYIAANIYYNVAADPYIKTRTPFDEIYYPIDENQKHVEIKQSNIGWIKNELVPQNIFLSSADIYKDWNNGEVRAQESITIEGEFSTETGAEFSASIYQWQDCGSIPPYIPYEDDALKGTRISNKNNKVNELKYSSTTNDVEIYPNPNNGKFSIRINNLEKFEFLEIINAQGKILDKQINTGNIDIEIDISKSPSGIYFVLSCFNGSIKTSKIIKF